MSARSQGQPGRPIEAPSKRREISDVSQLASGNTSSGVRTRRSASALGDPPDAPDADLDAEPEELICHPAPVFAATRCLCSIRAHTYERNAILSHFRRNGAKDPLTNCALSSTKVMTIWAMRNVVQAWLDKHPGVKPDGWDSRELLEPPKDDGTRTFDDEGDVRSAPDMACDVPCTAGAVAGGEATGGLGRGDDGKRPGGEALSG